MCESPDDSQEVVFLLDDTPLTSFYQLVHPFLSARGFDLSHSALPFLPIYYVYSMFERFVRLGALFLDLSKHCVARLPSANQLYSHLYHWYFFSGTKARLYIDYGPKYSYETAVEKSSAYYAHCLL